MAKRVTIVGAGALGSHLVQFLRSAGVELKVIDFDRIETKNVSSQFHSKPNVGKLKVQALQQLMQFLYGFKLEVVPHKLVSDNVDLLLGTADLLIDCLDNGEARRLVQAFAKRKSVPCLHGALAANGAFGRVVWTENFRVDDAAPGTPTCEDGNHLPFIASVSALLARAAQEFLRSGKKIGFEVTPVGIFST